MEVLSSSRFSSISTFPSLIDPVSRPPNPTCRRRRRLQTLLASVPADSAAPSPSSPLALSLSRILAAALRGGRARGELPDLAAASAGGAGLGTLLMSTTAAAVTKARESPYVLALAANPTFVSGMVALAVAQAAKAVLTSVVERRWSPRMLCSSGGMPSSHSALCTALTASVALCHGVGDALFPVCLGFSLIVMYDATGVRRHTGMQAEEMAPFLCYVVYIGRVPGVYERWQDCHMQVNGFPGNRYKGYMSRAVAEENWRNHLRQQNRTRTRTNFIVTSTTFFFVVACVFYFFTSRA